MDVTERRVKWLLLTVRVMDFDDGQRKMRTVLAGLPTGEVATCDFAATTEVSRATADCVGGFQPIADQLFYFAYRSFLLLLDTRVFL